MRDGHFASWEDIVSRFQTPLQKKKQVGDTRKWICIIDEQTHTVNKMDLQNLKVACAILISLLISQNGVVLGFKVIQDSGCKKVLLQAPNHIVTKKGKLRSSKVGVGYEVCAEIGDCIYYCPGDGICCSPGNPNSKCCPADYPLCLPEGCCPEGYPKVCGRYCCGISK